MELTLHFMPYTEIEDLSSLGRIRKLLNLAKQDKIVLLEGRLRKDEETELIKTTMEEINHEFKGIELAVISPGEKIDDVVKKMKYGFINIIMGERLGLTIIGPANIVREIKKDPNRIQLLTTDDGRIRGVKLKRKQKKNHKRNKRR